MFNTTKPQRGYRKLVAITLTLATALILAILPAQTQAAAATATARTVTVFRVDGRNADIFRLPARQAGNSSTRRTAPRTNVRIGANDTLVTGDNTQVYLNLDTLSLLKMDSNSEVNFELTDNLIGLNLQHGTALVQVAEQAAEQAIESRLGHLILAVRGTMFTMGHFEEEDIVFIVMLAGNGEIDGILLEEGQILTSWYDVNEPQVHISGQIIQDWRNEEVDRNIAISEIYLPELDTFTLHEIINNSEYLLENSNFVTQDLLNQIPPLLETETPAETPQRSFSDAQNRRQIALQNRRAEENTNNQNVQNEDNGDFGNFVVPQMPPVEELPIIPPGSGGNGQENGNDNGNGGNENGENGNDNGNGDNENGENGNGNGDGSDENGENGNNETVEYIVIGNQTFPITATSAFLANMSFTDTDIEPLANLTNLTWLTLALNNITNLEPLANLINLTELNLAMNNITNIEPLENLTNLTSLGLQGNNISNIEPLENLTNLTSLNLNSNNITNIEPLENLANLTSLGLSNNNISNLEPLASLTNLTELRLHSSNISNIEALANLTNLTLLDLWGNNITDWSPVDHIDNVQNRPWNWPRHLTATPT